MKLTKNKQFLADAIHASGKGWPDGANWAAQDKRTPLRGRNIIVLYRVKPKRPRAGSDYWGGDTTGSDVASFIQHDKLPPNWHQTILSREEYFSAYPAEPVADADGWIEWNCGERPVDVGVEVEVKLRNPPAGRIERIRKAGDFNWKSGFGDDGEIIAYRLHKPEFKPESNTPEPETKPTIEQLASDYRNAKDYAERKQQEADDAKAAADARLALLVDAGKALGLDVSPITEKKEPELAITNWRDLRVGDEVECLLVNTGGGDYADKRIGSVGRVIATEELGRSGQSVKVEFDSGECYWIAGWRFIRRP